MTFGVEIGVIVFMLILNAFFAAYEMALATITRARITVLMNEKKKGAAEAAYMKDRMEASLAIVQIGLTIAGACAAATGGAGVQSAFSPYLEEVFHISKGLADILALFFLIAPLSFMTISFGELFPKMIALNNNEQIMLSFSPLMKFFTRIMHPFIVLFEAMVKAMVSYSSQKIPATNNRGNKSLHELTAAVSLARATNILGAREEKIVLTAASLSSKPVKDILIPVSDIFMLSTESRLSEALLRAHTDMHTRFPVCTTENDPQTIIGYVNFKDIVVALKMNPADPSIRGITRPIKKVSEKTVLSQLLEQMIQEKTHIALISSVQDKIIGMVTLEDVMEELVGEIEDEFDRLPTYTHTYGSHAIIGGGVHMETVAATFGQTWSKEKSGGKNPTLAEWCDTLKPNMMKGGEVIEAEGFKVTVRKLRRKRVAEALVTV